MVGKSFLIGLLFAGLSAGVVYLGVGDTLDEDGSVVERLEPLLKFKKNAVVTTHDDVVTVEPIEASGQLDVSIEKPTDPAKLEIAKHETVNASVEANTTIILSVKPDRQLLDDAKKAANAGLYLDAADIIDDIKAPLMRDTARSNLAVALAKDGEKASALAVVQEVETDALAEIIQNQVNQVLAQ